MDRRVLYTGFEPFGPYEENPSAAVAEALRAQGHLAEVLPVEYLRAASLTLDAADRSGARVVVALGLSATAERIRIERFGHNRCGGAADNTGACPEGMIEAEGPNAYATPLDGDAIAGTLTARGLSAETSDSAGDYVCNDLYYRLLRHVEEGRLDACLFVHVPADVDVDRLAGALPEALERGLLAMGRP